MVRPSRFVPYSRRDNRDEQEGAPNQFRGRESGFRGGFRGGRSSFGRGGGWFNRSPRFDNPPPPGTQPNRGGDRGRIMTPFTHTPGNHFSNRPHPSPFHTNQTTGNHFDKGNQRTDSKRQPRENEQREYPCRCLFVRNIEKFKTTKTDIHEMFSAFGEIKTLCDKISETGVAYITFFDLRASESARSSLNGEDYKGRLLDVHFAFANPSTDRTLPPHPKDNQGSVKVFFRNFEMIPHNDQLYDYFCQFGDISEVHSTSNPHVKIITYFDSRACFEAKRGINYSVFPGGDFSLDLAWDKFAPIPLEEQYSRASKQPRDEAHNSRQNFNGNTFEQRPFNNSNDPLLQSNPNNGYSSSNDAFGYRGVPGLNGNPGHQPTTEELLEKAKEARELLEYIQTQTSLKLPEPNNGYYAQPSVIPPPPPHQEPHPAPPKPYFASNDNRGYYNPEINGFNGPPPPPPQAPGLHYGYDPSAPISNGPVPPPFYNNEAAPPTYSTNQTETNPAFSFYSQSSSGSTPSAQYHPAAPVVPPTPQESNTNNEVNQLLQLLAQANSKHGLK